METARLDLRRCAAVLALAVWTAPGAGRAAEPPEKKGPEHSVTLDEDEQVLALLKRAHAARDAAEKDPQQWPVCVKLYADILAKYPNTVYLTRWAGDNQEKAEAYGLGVYRSTAEKVIEELARLPAAGLAVYRAVNDPPARAQLLEGKAELDERKVDGVALRYLPTSWGDDALLWLAELAYDRGANRQVLMRLARLAQHPDPRVPRTVRLARGFLSQVKAGLAEDAQKTLAELTVAAEEAKAEPLRIGHAEGPAALAALKARLEAIPRVARPAAEAPVLETLLGNAAHNPALPVRDNVGVRKWSEPLVRLLGAPKGAREKVTALIQRMDGGVREVPLSNNTHLVAHGNWFFVTGPRVVACHSISHPDPERPQFIYPTQPPPLYGEPRDPQRGNLQALVGTPRFATLGGDYLYVTLGPEPLISPWYGRGGEQPKQQPNWILALGKARGGTRMGVESGSVLWTLQPDEDRDFRVNSQADTNWLQSLYFATSPTYADGALFVMMVDETRGNREAWAVSLDAQTGRLLWKTHLCSNAPLFFNNVIQPALALPVAVQGGTVYCVTNLGAVAALEAATGNIRWIRIYERVAASAQPGVPRATAPRTDFWDTNPPLVADDVLVITPQDSDFCYGLDTQTGRRKWYLERVADTGAGTDGLRSVIGLVNGRLVLSGAKVVCFVDAKNGRRDSASTPLPEGQEIAGRGAAAQDVVFIPTNKSILLLNAKLNPNTGKPIAKLLSEMKYTEPQTEAGPLFIAGDVLFSISATHVNAYFVWEEVEKKLLERLAASPADLAIFQDLGDLYQKTQRFEQALAVLDRGLALAAKKAHDAQVQEQVQGLNARKFEVFFSQAEKVRSEGPAAEARAAYERALRGAVQPEQSVRALWRLAEQALAQKDPDGALRLYQRVIAEQGDVVYAFDTGSPCAAAVFAQRRIEEIRKESPAAREKFEAAGREALAQAAAQNDAAALEKVLRTFPGTAAQEDALLALGDLCLARNDAGPARSYYQRFIATYPRSPRQAEASAKLALACEKSGQLGAAQAALKRLTRTPALAEAEIRLPGETPQKAGAWASGRLQQNLYARPATLAVRSLGDGQLTEAWKKDAAQKPALVTLTGTPPAHMLRHVVLLEGAADAASVVVRSGLTGEEAWTPRPRAPANIHLPPSGAWCEDLLVLAGRGEISAYNSRQNGKVAWTYSFGPRQEGFETVVPQGEVLSFDALEFTQPGAYWNMNASVSATPLYVALLQTGGALILLDAATGRELWRAKLEGTVRPIGGAVLGEGFVVATLMLQNQGQFRMHIYEAATGQRRVEVLLPSMPQRPIAVQGDSLYVLCQDQKLRVYSATDGKCLWEYGVNSNLLALEVSPDLVVLGQQDLELTALDPRAPDEGRRLRWKAHVEGAGLAGVVLDGEDVYVATQGRERRGQLAAFSSLGGKLKWKADIANLGRFSAASLAQGHILVCHSFDPQGRQASAAALIQRATGKLTWLENLTKAEAGLALFEGGVVRLEGQKLTGFLVVDPELATQDLGEVEKLLAARPQDPKLRLKLSQLLFDRGEVAQAAATAEALLSAPGLTAEAFAQAYEKFSRYRKAALAKARPELPFVRVRRAPVIDGDLSDWREVPATTLNSWRHVYLAGEADAREAYRKDAWAGSADLSATFQGAFDDGNLYLAFAVTDDVHTNPQTSGLDLWNGDSLQLAFDLESNTRMSYSDHGFELGLALNQKGEILRWRWVERGKYVLKPLESPAQGQFVVVRDEAHKRTVYEMALPLEYLGLKPESGARFGFTFMVNDRDGGDAVEKGLAPAPGIWNPKFPGQYGVGVLVAR